MKPGLLDRAIARSLGNTSGRFYQGLLGTCIGMSLMPAMPHILPYAAMVIAAQIGLFVLIVVSMAAMIYGVVQRPGTNLDGAAFTEVDAPPALPPAPRMPDTLFETYSREFADWLREQGRL